MPRACLGFLVFVLSACSLAPWGSSPQALPPLDPGKGRIVFYRTSSMLSSPQPADALLNGEHVGKTHLRGRYFRDVPPGSYAVATTLSARVVNFALAAGERKYIRFDNDFFGKYTYPQLVEPARGERESDGLERLPGR